MKSIELSFGERKKYVEKGSSLFIFHEKFEGGRREKKKWSQGGGIQGKTACWEDKRQKNTKKILLVGNVTKKVQNVTNKDKNVKTVRNNRETDVVPPLPYYGIEWEGERRGGDNPVGKANVGT